METHIKAAGCLLIALSFAHIIFPCYFKWKKDLAAVSLINRQMVYVHTFFIALLLLLMGVLCITSAKEIAHTALGHKIAFGFGLFWLARLFIQFFGYSVKLWKGKKRETAIHIALSILWLYFSYVFLAIVIPVI